MLCEMYQRLSPIEQIRMIGQIVHALQNDDLMFSMVKSILKDAHETGILDNVTILPNSKNEPSCTQQPFSLLQPE